MGQGKQVAPETVQCVVRVKRYFDEERRAGAEVSTRNPAARTSAALGLGEATVKRIMARVNRVGPEVAAVPNSSRGRPERRVAQHLQPVVRAFIREQNLAGSRVTVEGVRSHLLEEYEVEIPRATLDRTLRRWGFVHGEGKRRCALKEQSHVVAARREYLRAKRANRNPDGSLKRREVYLDETYVNKNHSRRLTWYLDDDGPWVNKPAGVGPRLIVVHAITREGWIEGAELVFQAKKRTGDYHGQMNWDNFSRWFTTQLVPNMPPGALVILDNASYHNVLTEQAFPGKGGSKEQLRAWLTHNHLPWREDMLKSELYDLCKRLAPEPEFRLDSLAAQHGHTILRTPPYHPELQPIETCWAVVKNHVADNCNFTMANLRKKLPDAFSKVEASTCQEILAKVVAQEDRFWAEDEVLDEVYSQDEKNECLAEELSGSVAEDRFLGES